MYYDHTYVYVHRPQQQQHHCKRAAGDSPLVAQLAEARKKKRATEIVAENQRDGGFVAATEKLVPSPWTSHPAYGSTSMGGDFTMGEAWEKFNAIVAAGTFVARHASGARGLQVCPSTRPAVVLS
jgi:hypothetical protein